jgi:coenzyme F420-reducing hydrogenase alpha subunit
MVGALARFNNNFAQLHPKAQAAAQRLNLKPKVTNPFLNSAAQVVEIVHSVEESILIIEKLLEKGIQEEKPAAPIMKETQGVGLCEVPRGMLIHHYWIAEDGKLTGANCIIPTNQNIANLEADMRALAQQIIDKPVEAMRLTLEMLVRAYDPCISCSVHVLKVKHR